MGIIACQQLAIAERTQINELYQDGQSNIVLANDSSQINSHFYRYSGYGMQSDILSERNQESAQGYDMDSNRKQIDISQNGVGYSGQRLDVATQTMNLGNGYRTYDPVTGSFMHADSLTAFSNQGTYNAFNYGAGNPVLYNDPTGHIGVKKQLLSYFTSSKYAVPAWGGIVAGLLVGAGSYYGVQSFIKVTEIKILNNFSVSLANRMTSGVLAGASLAVTSTMLGNLWQHQDISKGVGWNKLMEASLLLGGIYGVYTGISIFILNDWGSFVSGVPL